MKRSESTPDPLRTVVPVAPLRSRIGPHHAVLCLGSCFAEAIGRRLAEHCFRTQLNPLGPLYNPSSIAQTLDRLLHGRLWTSRELRTHGGLWFSFDAHAECAADTRPTALRRLNSRIAPVIDLVPRLDVLLLTFGTAWVWELRENGRIVANCHRVPAEHFTRRLLSVDEIVVPWTELLECLYALRPELRVVLTVSPVRHLRDNPHDNTVSKAHLVSAVYRLEKRFPALHYFPAYEIVLDELRDYRFFARDHAHLSAEAEEYVWRRFCQAALSPEGSELLEAVEPLLRAAEHRPRGGGSALHRFAREQLARLEAVESRFAGTDCSALRAHFSGLIARGRL